MNEVRREVALLQVGAIGECAASLRIVLDQARELAREIEGQLRAADEPTAIQPGDYR